MNKVLTIIAVCCVSILLLSLMPIRGEAEVYDNVIRLHVIANSDSKADQALKLKVRDSVLNKVNSLSLNAKNIDEATKIYEDNLCAIENEAKKCIINEGYDYDVSVSLTDERYPTKSYESLCFPSGEYKSLQIKIGNASGENWWCVLFPPLCMSVASDISVDESFVELGFSTEQYKIITNTEDATYKLKFKILETIEEAVNG